MKTEDREKLKFLRPGERIRVKSGSISALRNEISKANHYLPHKVRVVPGIATDGYIEVERVAEALVWSATLPINSGTYLTVDDTLEAAWSQFDKEFGWSRPGVVKWIDVAKPDMIVGGAASGGSDE